MKSIEKTTEISNRFCPLTREKCRVECALFGGDAECAISRIHEIADVLDEHLSELREANSEILLLKQLVEAIESNS